MNALRSHELIQSRKRGNVVQLRGVVPSGWDDAIRIPAEQRPDDRVTVVVDTDLGDATAEVLTDSSVICPVGMGRVYLDGVRFYSNLV